MADSITGTGTNEPIMIELGKHSRKNVKKLLRGEGKLFSEVASSVDQLKTNGTIAANAQPVVIIVKQKPRRNRSSIW